jgi:hypothetical protein
MKFVKKVSMSAGFVVLAAGLVSLLAPKAAHALVAALVQVTNTPSNPVPTLDVNRAATQDMELNCSTVVPEFPIGLTPVCALVSQTSGYFGPTPWAVPEGMNFVITDVDIAESGTFTLPPSFGIEWTPPGGSFRSETWQDSNPGTSQYHYLSGIVVLSGSVLTCSQIGQGNLQAYLHGYLTPN